jgi:hypothetical protein
VTVRTKVEVFRNRAGIYSVSVSQAASTCSVLCGLNCFRCLFVSSSTGA